MMSSMVAPASASEGMIRCLIMNSVSTLIGWAGHCLASAQQGGPGHAVATRLVAFRARCEAGNEDEVAHGQRRGKARGWPGGEMLVLDMSDLKSGARDNP